jgi:hypothetical protein
MSSVQFVASSSIDAPHEVQRSDVGRIGNNGHAVSAKAMELTDRWGQAMFILSRSLVTSIFETLGFTGEVSSETYDAVRDLAYVSHERQDEEPQPEVTYHAIDAACLALRGATDLEVAMSTVDDVTIEDFLAENLDLFERLMKIMPDYSANLMFSPEVAASVIAVFGATVSADKIYELGATYGRQATMDLDGRRGVSTQFIRSLTSTISARI